MQSRDTARRVVAHLAAHRDGPGWATSCWIAASSLVIDAL